MVGIEVPTMYTHLRAYFLVCMLLMFPSTDAQSVAQEPLPLNSLPGLTAPTFRVGGQRVDPYILGIGDLSAVEYAVQQGDSIWKLHRSHGIVPSKSAYKLFQTLNPQITNLNELRALETITVPGTTTPDWRGLLSAGARLLIEETEKWDNSCAFMKNVNPSIPLAQLFKSRIGELYVGDRRIDSSRFDVYAMPFSRYRVQAGDTITDLLNSSGVEASPFAYDLVLYLNPDIVDLSAIYPEQDVLIPCLRKPDGSPIIPEGALKIRAELMTPNFSVRAAALRLYAHSYEETSTDYNDMLGVAEALDLLHPLRPRLDPDINDYSDAASANLLTIVKAERERRLTHDEVSAKQDYSKDIMATGHAVANDEKVCHHMKVATVSGVEEICGLIVYWISRGDFHYDSHWKEKKKRFNTLSSPADTQGCTVPLGFVKFWATTQNYSRVSEYQEVDLSKTSRGEVTHFDLIIDGSNLEGGGLTECNG